MNWRLVSGIVGVLLLLEAVAMTACGIFARFEAASGNQHAMRAMLLAAAITGATGLGLALAGGLRASVKKIPRREAVLVVGLGWLVCSAFGGIPYLLCPPYLDVAGSFFESASGFTTTGSSVMSDIEAWPHGLLLWRSVTQWLGGIGILVLFVAVLSYLGFGAKSLFQNESSFRGGESGMARIQDTSLALLKIYGAFTAICLLGLRAMGLSWFHATCHAMTTVSTGGFSPHNKSLGHYAGWENGWMIEAWITLFMLMCSLNFLLYVVILRKNWRRLREEEDGRWLLGIVAGAVLLITFGRVWSSDMPLLTSLREASFQVASIVSTTGFGTADYEPWPAWAQMILALLMLVGGCAGSTAGGSKVGRWLLFLKSARHEIVRAFRPNLVFRLKVNGNAIDDSARSRTISFLLLYVVVALFSPLVVAALEAGTAITLESCLGAVIATLSNIGPGFGAVGPTENFGHFRDVTQFFLGWLMILGRLELFALLVVFLPSAWRRY
ncbi:MAG: TrkH family potassium uptake protein [Luteolibacter sp.]